MNNVILVGRLTQNPEIQYVGERKKARITLAINRERKNKQGIQEADFVPVELWGKNAELVCKYLFKGRRIGIEGQLRVERYKSKDGENRVYTKVVASSFKFLDNKSMGNNQEYFTSSDIFNNDKDKEDAIEEALPF